MLVSISVMLVWMTSARGNHFNGGTISWTPAIRNTTSSSVMITIIQSYSWMYPTISCQTNVPTSTNWILYPAVNLACIGNCSNQGGYSSNPINILTDCTSYSASLGILTSQRSVNVTFNESTYFWIAYQGFSWRSLANAATSSNPGWSIVSLINLRRRPDGLFNTPPVSHITSPQYVIVNRTATITIPVTDVDIGDDLRCRWSLKNRYCWKRMIRRCRIVFFLLVAHLVSTNATIFVLLRASSVLQIWRDVHSHLQRQRRTIGMRLLYRWVLFNNDKQSNF